MKIEEQAVSLELAKKLKELGVKQESIFRYCGGHMMYFDDQENGKFEECRNTDLLEEDEYCHTAELTCEYFVSAFTVAELGEMMPTASMEVDIRWSKGEGAYWGECFKFGKQVHLIGGEKTEADCRAKMLIYLLETEII